MFRFRGNILNMEHKLDPEALAQAWQDCKQHGDREARNALVLHYKSLVQMIAGKIAAQLPKMIDREDLVSYGLFGLLDAIEKYDLDRNVKFETYAITRIRGSIFDEIRDLDWVPRTIRAKARDVERAQVELHNTLGRPPSDAELAQHLGIPLIDLWATQAQTEAGQIGGFYNERDGEELMERQAVARAIVDPASNPEDLFVNQSEVVDLLADAIDSLSQRFKTILVLCYLHEMTLTEVGEVLGVTESRVCQLQSKLLATLHQALSQGLAATAA